MLDLPENTGSHSTDAQVVTNPEYIASVLRRLQEAHTLLTVVVPGDNQAYLSVMLELHPADGYLLLDELNSAAGNLGLLQARRFSVHAQLNGVDINFTTELQSAGHHVQAGYYRVKLPGSMRYRQRRASYRARISLAHVVPVLLTREDGTTLNGELIDISTGGIGTHHKNAAPEKLHQGGVWDECLIRLPGHADDIRSPLEICFAGEDRRSHKLRVGGKFLNLAPAQIKVIENFVAAIEREWLKKKRRERDE